FVCLAEVVQFLKPPMWPMAELRATPMTNGLVLAHLAFGMCKCFLGSKAVAACAACGVGPPMQRDIPQFPTVFHEKVAGIDIAVVFDDHIAVAGFVQSARPRFLARQSLCHVVEETDAYFAALRPPHVEDFAKETAVLLGRDRK